MGVIWHFLNWTMWALKNFRSTLGYRQVTFYFWLSILGSSNKWVKCILSYMRLVPTGHSWAKKYSLKSQIENTNLSSSPRLQHVTFSPTLFLDTVKSYLHMLLYMWISRSTGFSAIGLKFKLFSIKAVWSW